MDVKGTRFVLTLAVVAALGMGSAFAGPVMACPGGGACPKCPGGDSVKVSVTITGNIDDILAILQALRDKGLGVGSVEGVEDTVKLRVHSIASAVPAPDAASEAQPAATPVPVAPAPEPAVPPEPLLGVVSASVDPGAAKVGDTVVVTAVMSDPKHAVDTVGATLGDKEVDLFDNGADGDAKAGDGTWSAAVEVPAGVAAGKYTVVITAYDSYGTPVKAEMRSGKTVPFAGEATLTITP